MLLNCCCSYHYNFRQIDALRYIYLICTKNNLARYIVYVTRVGENPFALRCFVCKLLKNSEELGVGALQ